MELFEQAFLSVLVPTPRHTAVTNRGKGLGGGKEGALLKSCHVALIHLLSLE